jgi:hypothetical protein
MEAYCLGRPDAEEARTPLPAATTMAAFLSVALFAL